MGKEKSKSAKQIESVYFLGQAASEIINVAKKIASQTDVELECVMGAIELALIIDAHSILKNSNAIKLDALNREYPQPIEPPQTTTTPPTGE